MATEPPYLCVYPLSPSYLILHRYLYYLSLILAVLYPTPPPLIKGAFAFALTYSSTAALYAVLILAIPIPLGPPSSTASATTGPPLLDLDVLGLWAVLSPASILLLPLLAWSRSLQSPRSQAARPVVRIWGLVVLVGAACAFARLQSLSPGSASLSTSSSDASPRPDCQVLAAAADAAAAQKLRLRNPDRAVPFPAARLFSPLFTVLASRLAPLTFIPLAFGAVSSLVEITNTSTAAAAAAVTLAPPSPSQLHAVEISSADSTSTSAPALAPRKLFLLLRRVVLWLTPGWLVPVVVVNELYLLRGWPAAAVPEAESMYEVGQWGLVAGLGLVSAAAVVSWVAGGGSSGGGGSSREERYGRGDDVCIA